MSDPRRETVGPEWDARCNVCGAEVATVEHSIIDYELRPIGPGVDYTPDSKGVVMLWPCGHGSGDVADGGVVFTMTRREQRLTEEQQWLYAVWMAFLADEETHELQRVLGGLSEWMQTQGWAR